MITATLNQAFETVQLLVKKFENNKAHFMSATYSEAEARQDFIDNFFIALGWDVTHQHQHNPYQQDVKIEKSQKQQNESSRKRADYAFYNAPNYKDVHFFVEAKKPSVLIQRNTEHYFQTIKYGWNAGCPISILTDFEELVIIDCRSKPNIKYALNGAHKSYRYTDYTNKEKFAEIYYLFSKDAIAQKSIETYVSLLPNAKGKVTQKQLFKGGYQAIDDSFLEYIDGVRETIAKAFKKANPELDSEELTEATQRTVDRLVFTRFLEDKFIEPINHTAEWAAATNSWQAFIQDCKTLNAKYNGVVFKPLFIDKENFLGADEKLFGDICTELCSDNSPYDFNYIPIHILGSIYERFLGKIVVATAKQVRIEEKPEVRKAGGVYYTPKYIVDYIVANTVGKLIEGKTPTKIADMSFADIACGSGSFLIGVYDYLLQYHKAYYHQYPTVAQKDGCIQVNGVYTLSIHQKQDILLNNIYGVDVDSQAVEVTQLSLFLKMLEDETMTSTLAQTAQTSMYAKVLPDLTHNIVCGNSLIGTDILTGTLFSTDEERKLNAMDYPSTFPKIFKRGGFDAVVGNPPYVKERGSKNIFEPILLSHLGKMYHQGKMDFWYYFVHRGIEIIKENGYLSFITNSYWMKSDGASKLINRISKDLIIDKIVDFDSYKVFAEVSGKHNIAVFIKGHNPTHLCNVLSIDKTKPNTEIDTFKVEKFSNQVLILNNKINITTNKNLFEGCKILDDYFEVSQGVVEATDKITKSHKANNKNKIIEIGDGVFVLNEKEIKSLSLNKEEIKLLKPYVNTNHIRRYSLNFNKEYLLYLGKTEREDIAKGKYPNLKKHLDNVKEFITSSNAPYGIHRTRENRFFENEKLICKGMFAKPDFYYDKEKYYCGFSFSVIIQKNNTYDLKYLLSLMNSKVGEYWFVMNGKKRGVGVDIGVKVFREFPIPKLNLTNPSDKEKHDTLVSLVEQMLQTKQQLQTAVLEKVINYLTQKCTRLDAQIDALVYTLYGLTDEEIAIVDAPTPNLSAPNLSAPNL